MTLYEMLDVTLYYQEVWIYETNAYGQNMPIFKGKIDEARCDTEKTWFYLMCQVEHYECNTGILVIKVKNDHYEKRLETQYSNSDKWGTKENERPWKHDIEISMELNRDQEVPTITIKEYNSTLHPKISCAEAFITGLDHVIQKTDNPADAEKQLRCLGWSEECKATICEALERYKNMVLKQLVK